MKRLGLKSPGFFVGGGGLQMRCEAENEKWFKICQRFYISVHYSRQLVTVLPQSSEKVKDILWRKLTRLTPSARDTWYCGR